METHNTEKTAPVFWLKLGYAMGVSDKRIGICRDSEEMSRIAADAIKAGAECAGCEIYDLGIQNLPITRSAARFYKAGATAYAAMPDGPGSLKITLLDGRGIQAAPEKLLSRAAEVMSRDFAGFKLKPGPEIKDCTSFKEHYLRELSGRVKSESFNINMCLSTKSKTVSEIIGTALKELYPRLKPEARDNYAFRGFIGADGERLSLERADGRRLTREQAFSVMVYVLLRDSEVRTFVLPDYVSKDTEAAILRLGGSVVRVGDDESEMMGKMLEFGGGEQMMMQYDGVYCAVKILDFLNRFGISFDSLCDHLPRIFKSEAKVECGAGRERSVLDSLREQYNAAGDPVNGVRVKSGGGAVLIIPLKDGTIRIISESTSIEAAEEISTLFKNKIKTLAKGEPL